MKKVQTDSKMLSPEKRTNGSRVNSSRVMSRDQYQKSDKLLVATDCIIFGFDGGELKALLIKRDFEPEKGKWSLMGGFVNKNESVDDAAARILENLTGLTDIYMDSSIPLAM